MAVRVKKPHPALKHGGYSATGLLPGESAEELEKLRQKVINDIAPNGALEDDIAATLTHLLWRKQNLITFRIAEIARERVTQIKREKVPGDVQSDFPILGNWQRVDPAVREAAIRDAENQARRELGDDAYALAEIREIATIDRLMRDLDVQDRLDGIIDRCYKRLLILRGIKSLSAASSSAPPKRLAGPSKIGPE